MTTTDEAPPPRALVTGGAGFIGSRLVRALLAKGMRVWVLDNLLPQVHGPDARFPEVPGDVTWRRGDVRDAAALRDIVRESRPDLVFHLAADTGTGQSLDLVARYCDVNVMGTAHLIEAMREAALTAPRIVLTATRAVYGEGAYLDAAGGLAVPPARAIEDMAAGRFAPVLPEGPATRPIPTPETCPPRPASIYASSKLMQEHMLQQCAAAAGWSLAILRFQNVYGPGQSLRNPYTGVLSVFIETLLRGGDLNIYEDGEIVRDFVFVDDVVRSLVMAAEAERLDDAPINIGTGRGVSIQEVARMLARETGRDPSTCMRVTGTFRPGDVRHAVADTARARALLGWSPRVSVEEGIAALAAWARADRAEAPAGAGP
ncbi:NAD-dependent epimerase/dehydratase family protein [Muricoccus radiodurans]|uniref:NAD-dependent epimerase/dehydratase family protein n=1 Tax=Muricoccus radiodurans TaxID=2231721 RepID=UPI003CE76F8C